MSEFEKILADIESAKAATMARQDWKPAQQGEIDIRIDADGNWFHEGRRFQRDSLVKLFASVLRREKDDYYLVTPAEQLRIQVEDAPFVATLVESVTTDGADAIVFTTNLGERILLDRDHALRIETDPRTGEPRPYLQLDAGLEALISRRAFYDLINLGEERERDGSTYLVVRSLDQEFELGKTDG